MRPCSSAVSAIRRRRTDTAFACLWVVVLLVGSTIIVGGEIAATRTGRDIASRFKAQNAPAQASAAGNSMQMTL